LGKGGCDKRRRFFTKKCSLPLQFKDDKIFLDNYRPARVCSFVPKEKANPEAYHAYQIPSLRKLEQFDQVMRQAGTWGQIKVSKVKTNLLTGVIKKEKELVDDTTRYPAYSGFETVNYEDAKGHEKKKSQSKVTKTCHCEEWSTCAHAWELSDEGNKMLFALKSEYP
jgi:hypothetical protein